MKISGKTVIITGACSGIGKNGATEPMMATMPSTMASIAIKVYIAQKYLISLRKPKMQGYYSPSGSISRSPLDE